MKKLFFAVLALVFIWHFLYREKRYPPGVLVREYPVQEEVQGLASWTFGKYRITPLASYVLKARILHRKKYRYDRGADLSPLDLAVGWGVMSDQSLLDGLSISQSMRWYYVRWGRAAGAVDETQIFNHSANVHIIPSDEGVRKKAFRVKAGDIVRMRGYLVQVEGPDSFYWKSSLSRSDTGKGSCELFWLKDIG